MAVLLGLGVFIARRRRRALIGAGLGFAASMLVLGAALLTPRRLPEQRARQRAPRTRPPPFDILVRFIKAGLRALLVAGLIVAAGAFFTGPSVTAVRTRSALSSPLGW